MPLCPNDGGGVILENNVLVRTKICHHGLEEINQKHFVLICTDKWSQTVPAKMYSRVSQYSRKSLCFFL